MKTGKIYPTLVAGFLALAGIYFVHVGSWLAPVCAFAGPALFLYSFRQCSGKRQRLITWFVFAAGLTMMNLHYCPSVFLDIPIFFLSALFIWPAFLLDSRYGGGDRRFWTTLIFPAVWVSLFHISTLANFGFQFRLDAFVTLFLTLIQIDSVIGTTGLIFLVLWTGSVVVYAAEKLQSGGKVSLSGVAACVLILAGSLVFGAVRLHSGSEAGATVRVAYTTGPYVGDYVNNHEPDYKTYTRSLRQSVRRAVLGGAELLVFNEEAFLFPDYREEDFNELVSSLARSYKINILTGEEIYDTDGSNNGKSENRITWTDANGQVLFRYVKHSLVPIVESFSYTAGEAELPSAVVPFACGDVKVSAVVCYDSNFSDNIASMPHGTQLLFIPSWDWTHITEYHGEVARELAIENGVTVLKDTYDGISLMISPLGETLSLSTTGESGFETVHFVDMPVQSRDTFFGNAGFLYGYIFTGLTAAAVLTLEILKRKNQRRVEK